MTFQISPGVTFREIDLTPTVPVVSTSVGAIAGNFKWGPAAFPVLVTNSDDMVKTFLKPDDDSRVDFLSALSFLTYSNNLRVSRAFDESTSRNAVSANDGTPGTTAVLIKNANDYEDGYLSPSLTSFIAKYPGTPGNGLRVYLIASKAALDEARAMSLDMMGVPALDRSIYSTIVSTVGSKAPGTSARAAEAGSSNDEIHIFVVDYTGGFSGFPGTVLESFLGVSLAVDAKTSDGSQNYYVDVLNSQSQYIWWNDHPEALLSVDVGGTTNVGTVFGPGKSFSPLVPIIEPITFEFALGTDGVISDAEYIAAYDVFADPETVDVSLLIAGGRSSTVALHCVQNIAEVRRDLVVFVSPPREAVVNSLDPLNSVIEFRDSALVPGSVETNTLGGYSSSYMFIDSNWKYTFDSIGEKFTWIPCAADCAGLCARTDFDRDAWWSPAGFNRGNLKGVQKLAWNPNEAQRDVLYQAEINPIVSFPGRGTVLFGDKTALTRASAFDRINVRRLFIVLEKSISAAAQTSIFEFNDRFTRSQFVSLIEPRLREIQGRRGITAFRVECSEINNPPSVVDANSFVADIYIQPARSINFIKLNFIATRTGVNFDELIGAA